MDSSPLRLLPGLTILVFAGLLRVSHAEPVSLESEDLTDDFLVAPGFRLEKLGDVPGGMGSWVSMTRYRGGAFICGDQYGGLYLLEPPGVGGRGGTTVLSPLGVELGGAHGLLWHDEKLYVSVNEQVGKPAGIYVVEDLQEPGQRVRCLREFRGTGEHGLHALVPSPDGEWIYHVAGNMSDVPKVDYSHVPEVWGEDQLITRNPDGQGHAANVMAPGGFVTRFRRDGSRWELVATGFRNPYDMAFNDQGDLFVYDADMEWDIGMPWYRPTRLCHTIPGAEFGWRNGTGKWPSYYEDSIGAVVELGGGSPTGVVSGRGLKFPSRYQRALFLLDWSYGTLYAVSLAAEGSSYRGMKEEFVAGPGLPLTDAAVGDDGALYFMTGGRRVAGALWRVRYTGEEDVSPVEVAPAAERAEDRSLNSTDRLDRFRARVGIELAGPKKARHVLDEAGTPWEVIGGAIALSRVGEPEDRPLIFEKLATLTWSGLGEEQRLAWLRAWDLLFIRLGEPTGGERERVLSLFDAEFPGKGGAVDWELCRLLCYLDAPGIIGRALDEMAKRRPGEVPEWVRLAERNAHYGRPFRELEKNPPPSEGILYAYFLRDVKQPWTGEQRARLWDWFQFAESKSGGASYLRFLQRFRRDFLERATPDERAAISAASPASAKIDLASLPRAKGPGKAWTQEEIVNIARDLAEADPAHGRKMFEATYCVACHQLDGSGGATGPDLTTLRNRFSPRALAQALLDPSAEVSDQFRFQIISKNEGGTLFGRVLEEKDEVLILAVNPYDFDETVEVSRGEIKSISDSPISPMPGGLINQLNREELRDLLAYLLGKGG